MSEARGEMGYEHDFFCHISQLAFCMTCGVEKLEPPCALYGLTGAPLILYMPPELWVVRLAWRS